MDRKRGEIAERLRWGTKMMIERIQQRKAEIRNEKPPKGYPEAARGKTHYYGFTPSEKREKEPWEKAKEEEEEKKQRAKELQQDGTNLAP